MTTLGMIADIIIKITVEILATRDRLVVRVIGIILMRILLIILVEVMKK